MTNEWEALQLEVHANSVAKGFWEEGVNQQLPTKVALLHSECSELLEAYRTGNPSTPCDKFAKGLPLSREEEEMADILLRLMDLAAYQGVDLMKAAAVKHAFNKTRPTKHGGKEF